MGQTPTIASWLGLLLLARGEMSRHFRLWTDPPFLSCEFAQHRNFESWAAECYLAAKTTV